MCAGNFGCRAGIAILSSRRPCRFHWGIMLFRADAATRRFIPQDRELCAGEMLRLAGYSAGRSVCARGGTVCGACGSVGMSCVRFTPAMRFCWDVWRLVHACHAVLLECLAFGSRLPCGSVGMSCVWFTPAVRFCWYVWRLVHACRAVLLECLAFGSRLPCGSVGMSGVWFTPAVRFCWNVLRSVHACLFSFVRKRETACGMFRSYSAGSRSPLVRSRSVLRLSALAGSLRVFAFLCGDPDGVTGDAGNEKRGYEGTGLAARPLCAFAQAH